MLEYFDLLATCVLAFSLVICPTFILVLSTWVKGSSKRRYNQRDHKNSQGSICHGPDCLIPGLSQLAPRISGSLKHHVAQQLLRDIPPRDIIRQNQHTMQRAYQEAHKLSSVEEAELAMKVCIPC